MTGIQPANYLQHTVIIQNLDAEVDIVGPAGSGYDGTPVVIMGFQNTVVDSGLWAAWVAVNQNDARLIYQLSVVPGSQT